MTKASTMVKRRTLASLSKEMRTLLADSIDTARDKGLIPADGSQTTNYAIEVESPSGVRVRFEALPGKETISIVSPAKTPRPNPKPTPAQIHAVENRRDQLGLSDAEINDIAGSIDAGTWMTDRRCTSTLITELDGRIALQKRG